MNNSNQLASPFNSINLERLPRDFSQTLRAWDAADEYLLQHLYEHHPDVSQPLIFNDSFGALSLSLLQQNPVSINDSFVSQQALRSNQQSNSDIKDSGNITLLDSITPLPAAPIAILKLPKNSRYFEYQLQALNHYLPAGTPVIISAMVKYLSSSFFKLFEQHLSETSTTLAKKKARLLIGITRGAYAAPTLDQPRLQSEIGLTLFDTPNVFAAGKLDQGSRFFLQNFPDLSDIEQAVDLGCGNGILGLNALQKNPQLKVSFVDESCHAIHATRCAVEALGVSGRAELTQNHCLLGFDNDSVDTVLCNPPFHQQQAVGIQIAQQMFRDSARVLKSGCSLYIIGNRHLGYHVELKKHFKNVQILANDKKFVLWAAQN
ncbi:MAG: methyltransferase [Pseudomonadales bacterium]